MSSPRRVALVTLGCARNEVDSEELAGRLAADGWELVQDADDADAVVVNTCGFVEAAKTDSIDTLLAAADLRDNGRPRAVVAVGCLAERYGEQLAQSLPEADAVLGFDDYPDIADRLRRVVAGESLPAHAPRDRRRLLPLSPVDRAQSDVAIPGHGTPGGAHASGSAAAVADTTPPTTTHGDAASVTVPAAPAAGPPVIRRRLDDHPTAPLKLASGCDRRCSFCAIPAFRGSFVSRRPTDVLAEARWLAGTGARELVLVSENSTSYGKDLGDLRLLEALLPELAAVPGVERVRVSYLQPAEMRPTLVDVMTSTDGVAAYFDLSFQHASRAVLRRMRRFGGTDDFLALLDAVRARAPHAGVRSNVIVGFPGETEADLDELVGFLATARLDAVGVFGFSPEDGTEAAELTGQLPEAEVRARVERVTDLVDELMSQRAEERIGETLRVLVEDVDDEGTSGRAEHQGPETDGLVRLVGQERPLRPGDVVTATVVSSDGVDLVARVEFGAGAGEPR